ncbi:hypothetical protein ACKUZO_019680 [Acinetobacter baumannii]
MEELVNSHKGKIISICDADFDHIEDLEHQRNKFDIYLTDYHDSEVMMLKSGSLFSFIDEYSKDEYLLSLKSELLNNVFNASKALGILRYINYKYNMKLSFKN